MSNSIVATVYSGVIKDVIQNMKEEFASNGVHESVLTELERLWEHKIRTAKVATWEANGLTGEDHNQNNQNINGGSSNSAHYMQQQQPMPQQMQQMQPQSDPNLKFPQSRDSQAAASLPNLALNNMHTNHNNEGRPQPYNIKNGNIQLTAQSSPTSSFPTSSDISNSTPINNQADDQKIYHHHQHQNIHTLMGQQQDEYGNPLNEKLIPRGENSANSSPLPEFTTRSEPSFADNDDINSDLDDTDDDDTNADGEETQNIILCLYDKVTRTKNKWKCQLKDGIMSVNGRDYLFQKGNGDFEF